MSTKVELPDRLIRDTEMIELALKRLPSMDQDAVWVVPVTHINDMTYLQVTSLLAWWFEWSVVTLDKMQDGHYHPVFDSSARCCVALLRATKPQQHYYALPMGHRAPQLTNRIRLQSDGYHLDRYRGKQGQMLKCHPLSAPTAQALHLKYLLAERTGHYELGLAAHRDTLGRVMCSLRSRLNHRLRQSDGNHPTLQYLMEGVCV